MLTFLLILISIFQQPGDSLNPALDKYLKKNLSQYESYEFKILQMPPEYKKIEIVDDRDLNLSGNLVYVPVKIVNKDGRSIKSIITIKLTLFKSIPVAIRRIDKNEKLNASDFEIKKVDVSSIQGSLLLSTKGINQYRNRIILKPGDPLIKENLQLIPVINAGDLVEAKYNSHNVTIIFDAISRQEGIPGEKITVISRDKKEYKAKVIDSKNVQIIE